MTQVFNDEYFDIALVGDGEPEPQGRCYASEELARKGCESKNDYMARWSPQSNRQYVVIRVNQTITVLENQ